MYNQSLAFMNNQSVTKHKDLLFNQLGRFIFLKRKELELTQERLAYKANLSVNYIRKIEKGLVNPSLNTIRKIAKALELSLNDLIKEYE